MFSDLFEQQDESTEPAKGFENDYISDDEEISPELLEQFAK